MKDDSLKKRYSIKLFANIISALVNAFIVAIVPKALGPVAYGEFIYLQNFFAQIIGFLDMGSSIAFFTKISANHKRKELITFYIFYTMIVLTLLFIFLLVLDNFKLISFIIPNISINYIYYGLLFGFLIWITQIFFKISDAYALTFSIEVIKIVHKIIFLLLLLFFVFKLSFDLELFFYYHYISLISFLFLVSFLFIKKGIFQNIINLDFSILNLLKEFFSYCHPLVIYSIIGLLTGLFDIWILQKVSGSEQMGFYGLAYSLSTMCFLFTSAMTPIITREFSKTFEQNDITNMKKLFSRYIPMLYSIAAYFGVFISIQSENVLMIFADEKFKGAYLALVFMSLYPIHQTYGQLSGSVFYATGQTKLLRNIALVTQPIGVLFTIIFIYLFDLGALGLVYKMIIAQIIAVTIQLYYNSKLLGFKIKYFIFHQLYSIVFFAVLAFFSSNVVSLNSPLFEFIISGFIYTVLVTIFVYIFPQIFSTTRDEIKINFLRFKQYVTKK